MTRGGKEGERGGGGERHRYDYALAVPMYFVQSRREKKEGKKGEGKGGEGEKQNARHHADDVRLGLSSDLHSLSLIQRRKGERRGREEGEREEDIFEIRQTSRDVRFSSS